MRHIADGALQHRQQTMDPKIRQLNFWYLDALNVPLLVLVVVWFWFGLLFMRDTALVDRASGRRAPAATDHSTTYIEVHTPFWSNRGRLFPIERQ